MKELIELLESGRIKGKHNNTLAELLYNKNGQLVTSNLNYINSAYNLKDLDINITIKRIDYSNDYIITIN